MSWLIVLIGEQAQNIASLLQLEKKGRILCDSPALYIAVNKKGRSSFYTDEILQQGWAYSGCMQAPPPHLQAKQQDELFPDGHFALVRWNNAVVQLDTDVTGLRSFYVVDYQQVRIITTHIPIVASLVPATVDFSALGSAWLLVNQINTHSVIQPYRRIIGGEGIRIERDTLSIQHYTRSQSHLLFPAEITISSKKNIETEIAEQLGKNISTWSSLYKHTVLSLSGGFDSRVILALLLQRKTELSLQAITVGKKDNPDVILANKVAESCRVEFMHVREEGMSSENLLHEYQQYACSSMLNKQISAFPQLWMQRTVARPDTICFDGGFGEIWRRGFFNRLLYRGKRAVFQGDIQHLTALLAAPRPAIFTPDITQTMQQAAYNDVAVLWESMPSATNDTIETWLDLLALRTRLPNYYAADQTYNDGFGVNIMPFAQTSVLQNLLYTSVHLRKNGTMWRQYIAQHYPHLAEIPLAKGESVVPFRRSVLRKNIGLAGSLLYSKLFSSSQTTPKPLSPVLKTLLPTIADIAHSSVVRERGIYDMHTLHLILDKAQSGFLTDKETLWLDWWFSFEVFHCGMNGEGV